MLKALGFDTLWPLLPTVNRNEALKKILLVSAKGTVESLAPLDFALHNLLLQKLLELSHIGYLGSLCAVF